MHYRRVIAIPNLLPRGIYYVRAIVDDPMVIAESNELNLAMAAQDNR
jgi:hypothetical protein